MPVKFNKSCIIFDTATNFHSIENNLRFEINIWVFLGVCMYLNFSIKMKIINRYRCDLKDCHLRRERLLRKSLKKSSKILIYYNIFLWGEFIDAVWTQHIAKRLERVIKRAKTFHGNVFCLQDNCKKINICRGKKLFLNSKRLWSTSGSRKKRLKINGDFFSCLMELPKIRSSPHHTK